jgi:hypothetical protein
MAAPLPPLSNLAASKTTNIQSVLEYELDPITGTWVTKSVPTWTLAMEYDGANNLIYFGRAAPGSAKSDPVWQILKFTYAGTNVTDQQYAGGSNLFTHVWDNRAALSYS